MKLNTTKMLAHVEDGIGWITFNSPERRNAISLEMWEGLGVILENFQNDKDVRVVVMKGAGDKAFVSGADISEFDTKRGSAEQKKQYGEVSANANRWLGKLDKPLIAMIQGFCIGGGLATALSADVRFATPDSTFGIPAAKLDAASFVSAQVVATSRAYTIGGRITESTQSLEVVSEYRISISK